MAFAVTFTLNWNLTDGLLVEVAAEFIADIFFKIFTDFCDVSVFI